MTTLIYVDIFVKRINKYCHENNDLGKLNQISGGRLTSEVNFHENLVIGKIPNWEIKTLWELLVGKELKSFVTITVTASPGISIPPSDSVLYI